MRTIPSIEAVIIAASSIQAGVVVAGDRASLPDRASRLCVPAAILTYPDRQKDQSQNGDDGGIAEQGSCQNMAGTFLAQRISEVRMRDVVTILVEGKVAAG
ncbi:hypothetical protein [Mesorhizobium sp. M0208]|uniref:hypothetical protein n=1 Tax=Mesorhizobium sp. M0208 TaxID=2956916 RepID=UPI003336F6B2